MGQKHDKKNVSPDRLARQIWKAVLKNWVWTACLIIAALSWVFLSDFITGNWMKLLKFVTLSLFAVNVIAICNNLTEINSLLRKEGRITWCQIWILFAIGIWIVGTIFIIDIQNNQQFTIPFGIAGSVLAWIFQDKIKGAVAFIHFRKHNLLNIGDWIRVPKDGVDGVVKKVTLTNVTLYNWDTTTSTIPINTLQSDHFMNLQNMSDGKTYGRNMQVTFTIDAEKIRPVTEKEIAAIKSGEHDIARFLQEEDIQPGVLNAKLYRLYLYHWLLSDSHVSQLPRLFVRWIEHKDTGMALDVYLFLTDSNWSCYEWQKSRIVEHILTSMTWFDLRLYQSPSAYSLEKLTR